MKQINYKTTRRIAVTNYIIAFFVAIVFLFSSYGACDLHAAEGDGSPKKEKTLSLLDDEPRKLSKTELKEETEMTRRLLSLGNLMKFGSPNTRGMEIDSTGALIISKDIVMANLLREKTISPELELGISIGNLTAEVNAEKGPEPSAGELSDAQSDTSMLDDDDIIYEGPSINLSKTLDESSFNYVPERNKQINTGFFVKIPKEMLSSKWSLTLSPKLLMNDSVVALREVVLTGDDFKVKQKESYENYKAYLESIVKKQDYDKHFIDREGINKDLKVLQDVYLNKYQEDWSVQMAYEKWRAETIDKKTREIAKKVGQRNELYYRTLRDIQEDKMAKLANGKDTSGIYSRYMSNFEKKTKDLPEKFEKPEITENDVPKEFKEIFQVGRKLDDLTNGHLTDQDSIEIAKHRYMFDKIAENEYKDSTKEEKEKLIIPFPYNREAMLDSIMNGEQNFYYYYPHTTRMIEAPTTYRLVVDSKFDVFPHNTYSLPQADTMTYAVTSLVDLVDPQLTVKETKIYRNMFNRVPIYPKFESNKVEFKTSYSDNRDQIKHLISEYKTYVEEQGLVVDSALIRVSCSLDGNFYTNYTLSEKRGNSLKSFITDNAFPLLDVEGLFRVTPVGEDWKELVRQISRRDDMPNKDAILDMIYATTDPDLTESEIKKKYRTDFRIMKDSIYPSLRKADIIFFIHRPNMDAEEGLEYTEQPGYEKGLNLMRSRKYWDALQILSQYPDYNTAVCLASMGHNEKAYEVLNYLKSPGAEVDYLKAIVTFRMGRESEAVEFLQSACEKDPLKMERAPKDPEIVSLIDKYSL